MRFTGYDAKLLCGGFSGSAVVQVMPDYSGGSLIYRCTTYAFDAEALGEVGMLRW